MVNDQVGVYVHVDGDDIYQTFWMPAAPRKGDVLMLSSLTRGACPVPKVLVSSVEWTMEQQSGVISVWVRVRRINRKTP